MEIISIGQMIVRIDADKANFGILILLLVFLLVYCVYSIIALIQVRILNNSTRTKAASVLNNLALLQLLVGLGLLLIVILSLL